jgi:hypothetical protein
MQSIRRSSAPWIPHCDACSIAGPLAFGLVRSDARVSPRPRAPASSFWGDDGRVWHTMSHHGAVRYIARASFAVRCICQVALRCTRLPVVFHELERSRHGPAHIWALAERCSEFVVFSCQHGQALFVGSLCWPSQATRPKYRYPERF